MRNRLFLLAAWSFVTGVALGAEPATQDDSFKPIVDEDRQIGIVRADVDDYVQDGLVAHFDGVRNAGAKKSHDGTTTRWVDLVDETRVASFSTVNINVEKKNGVRDGRARWLSDGYYFDGTVFAQMQTGVALGMNATIQLVTTCDTANQMTNQFPNVFAAPDDFCFFFGNFNTTQRQHMMYWKHAPYAAPGNNYDRPTLPTWGGRYMTAVLGDDAVRLFEGTSLPTSGAGFRTRVASVAIPETQWTWGGSAFGPAERTLIGVVHAVRLYNRVLTEAELEQNRRVDELRFRTDGDGKVTVESTMPGAEANEPCGMYNVNGWYAFSAPERTTVGGIDYAPVGYQVEYWNAASNVWGRAAEFAGTSFVYTNCAARPRARLTWIWKPVRGVVRWDASAYAQHGLAFNYDGIENAGYGRHSVDTDVWTNLVPNGISATRQTFALGGAGGWTSRGFRFEGKDYFKMDRRFDFGDKATLQVVADFEGRRQLSTSSWPTFFGSDDDVFNFYTGGKGEQITFKLDAVIGSTPQNGGRSITQWTGTGFNAFLDFDSTDLRMDASAPSWRLGGDYKNPIGLRTFYLGGIPMGKSDSERAARSWRGHMFAVRGYTRVLSSYELVRNRELDMVRFHGGVPASVTSNGVWVVSAAPGLPATVASTFYEVLGDAHTFTAPTDDVVANGRTYRLLGYAREAWNAETQQWEWQEASSAAAWTLTPSPEQPVQRLTWRWQVVRGLRTAADYDVGDYVQTGLVANYDGIRNYGVDLPHDSETPKWRDVSGNTNDCALGGTNTSSGAWTDDGYAFVGMSYFKMGKGVTMGRAFTIQAVCDVEAAQQITNWPNYVAAMNDYGVFTGGKGTVLNWKTDAWTGERSRSANWMGDYFTALMTTNTVYIFDGTAYANGVERTKDEAVPLWRWTIGACENGANERYMVGKMQAVRFYGRPLTEEELAWNRKVDDVRYKGRVVTNVVVASDRPFCAGVESNGVYEVEGTWTFTAKPMAVADRTYAPAGYTIETWTDGGWSAPFAYTGTNYTYVAEAAAPAVRLTWKFRSTDGTLIMIR